MPTCIINFGEGKRPYQDLRFLLSKYSHGGYVGVRELFEYYIPSIVPYCYVDGTFPRRPQLKFEHRNEDKLIAFAAAAEQIVKGSNHKVEILF